MSTATKGSLIIIGGHEDKEGDCTILREVARRAGKSGRIVLMTVATELPEEVGQEYRAIFKQLGVERVDVLDIRTRAQAYDEATVQKLADTPVIFFTGGDQLRLTSQLGDSPVYRCMQESHRRGGTIVGTSAGAAAMPETMLNGGKSDKSLGISALTMAPGLGLLPSVVIDSHFAERGRMGRLLEQSHKIRATLASVSTKIQPLWLNRASISIASAQRRCTLSMGAVFRTPAYPTRMPKESSVSMMCACMCLAPAIGSIWNSGGLFANQSRIDRYSSTPRLHKNPAGACIVIV